LERREEAHKGILDPLCLKSIDHSCFAFYDIFHIFTSAIEIASHYHIFPNSQSSLRQMTNPRIFKWNVDDQLDKNFYSSLISYVGVLLWKITVGKTHRKITAKEQKREKYD
jgi:hypothetical protein